MTFIAKDQSVQDGDPVHLISFVQGSLTWRYALVPFTVSALGETWVPSTISAGAVNQTPEMAKNILSMKFPRDHEFARTFLWSPPDQVTSVTMYRGHLGDPDNEYITTWKGRVANARADGDEITLECEHIFTSLRRPGLRARFQKSCRHALYGRGCNLDQETFAVAGTCTAVDGATLTVPEAAALSQNWLIGGMLLSPDMTLRYIVGHSGDQVELIRPVQSLAPADAVQLYPGCDHSRGTCLNKFSNLDNYGGYPWIPTKNPFGGSSIA